MGLETIATLAAVTSAGVGIAGAAGAFNPDMPAPPNFGAMTRDAMAAELEFLPQKVSLREQFDPEIAALRSRIDWDRFFGRPASSQQRTRTVQRQVEKFVPVLDPQSQVDQIHFGTPLRYRYERQLVTEPVEETYTENVAAAPGLLDLAERAQPRISALERVARDQSLKDVRELGPQAFAALRAYDPASTAILDRLAADAQGDLDLGYALGPSLTREVQQAVRAGQADRGLGYGTTDVFTEAMQLGSEAERRRRERQQFASSVASQRAAIYGDPFIQVLGRSSGRTAPPQSYLLPESSMVSPGVNPAAYQSGLAGYSAQNAANIAGHNTQQGYLGSLMRGATTVDWGSLFGNQGRGGTFDNGLSWFTSPKGGGIGGLP